MLSRDVRVSRREADVRDPTTKRLSSRRELQCILPPVFMSGFFYSKGMVTLSPSTRSYSALIAAWAAFGLAVPFARSATGDPAVKVLRSDARAIVFEYRPAYHPLRMMRDGATEYTLLDFEGSSGPDPIHEPGVPDLRWATIPLGFPSEEGNAVQVVAADYEDIANTVCSPVPLLRMADGMIVRDGYAPDAALYGRGAFLPGTVAGLLPVGRSRSMLVGGVRITPVQWNPSTRVLRKYTRLVVEVVYGAPRGAGTVNDDDRIFAGALLNYDFARSWKIAFAKPSSPASSVLASGGWYRIPVTDEGIYRIDAAYLGALGINVGAVDPRTIKIFGNGGQEVPESIFASRDSDLVENAIYVAGESDGTFDAGDFVLFYARGTRAWRYDAAAKTLRHYLHHYTETNTCWLTVGGSAGKRMQLQPSSGEAATVVPRKFTDGVAVEEELVNLVASGKDWYGQALSPGTSFTHVNLLSGLLPDDVIVYRYTMVAHSDYPPSFTVKENATGVQLGVHGLGIGSFYSYATAGTFQTAGTSNLPGGSSQLNFTFNSQSVGAAGWIDWIEILYPRAFNGIGEYLRFRSPDTAAVVEYQLGGFSGTSPPMVFNVTASSDVRVVAGLGAAYVFRARETGGSPSEYCAAGPASWKTPAVGQKVPNQNLRGIAPGYDFIIVTSPEFMSAATRLQQYREDPTHGDLSTLVVDVAQVYNEFSGGLPDVAGIRDFLKYASDRWTRRPQYVLFLGGASYDYKGILGSRSSYVPTWQSAESRSDVYSWATDDFYAKFGPTDALSLVLGRISSRTPAEASLVIDKIMRYEQRSVRDNWKMRVLYIADDAWTSDRGDSDGTQHADQAEELATVFTPDEVEKKKIYIAEYPTVNTAQGRRKPGAYQDIIDQVNRGMLIVNYTGHGNPTLLAHENIFNVQTSIPQLTNADRLCLFFLATCNFSQFDDPKRYTGSEVLMNKPEGAAVAVISAARKVFADDNAFLNQRTYAHLFTQDRFGRVIVNRPAAALFLFKSLERNYDNDQKYFFMGDPTMQLQFPRGYATIDSVNGQSAVSGGGNASASAIQLKSLSLVTVKGSIRDTADQVDGSFGGSVTLVVNDASQRITIVNFYPGAPPWRYNATGGTIYHGVNSVTNGRFTASFIVPKDIAYADSTSRGRLVAYFSDASADGAGYTGDVRIGGTDSTARNDGQGPSIALYLDSRGFRSGDMVGEKPVLYADLKDSSGINTSGSGIGHRIEAWVNNSTQSKDVTSHFTNKLNSYSEGTVQYPLIDLPQGRNTLRLRAWDSFNNSATAETYFEVSSSDHLTLSDVFNYPNPFAGSTIFTFRQNQAVPLSVAIKIYTLAGRLIQTLETMSAGEPFIRIPWDGRDRDGDAIANGVYLYKVIAKTADGRFSSEALGKLSIVQ
jgi:hypothetical protein